VPPIWNTIAALNLFGVDVRGLDVESFLASGRQLYPLVAIAWLALVVRLRRPGLLLAGVLLANAFAWFETNWPLQRLYALGPSSDRLNNVALCQVVAVGHSPLHTPVTGQMHFEPFWAVVTAVLSGWSPERLLRIYPFLSLVTACGFALSLFFALRPPGGSETTPPADGDRDWSGWERALIALFATLLSSVPLDYASPYRVPWAMTFLLKPNHAVGLVLMPWVVRGFARIRGGKSRIGVGVLLHALGWAFVIHMGAVCAGLITFAILSTLFRREEARRDWADAAAVIGINLLVVSPYLWMLFQGYGVFHSGPRMMIPPSSPHLLEATTRIAALGALAMWGAVVAWRRDRLGRVWASMALAALLLWLAYYPLSAIAQAKERDDMYYWLRVHVAVCAAIGAWDLGRRVAPRLAAGGFQPAVRAAMLTAVALPFTLPYWWDPVRMDLYFPGSVPPLPAEVTGPAGFLRAAHARDVVLAGDPAAARWMAALAGARVLLARDFQSPDDSSTRMQVAAALARGGPSDRLAEAARFGVSHLVVTPELLAVLGLTLEEVDARPYLRRVHFSGDPAGDYVALFAVGAT
jgi:hypothetical protein